MRATFLMLALGFAGASSFAIAACCKAPSAPSAATRCGTMSCGPGYICVKDQPGSGCVDMARFVDGGSGGDGGAWDCDTYSCAKLPSECDCNLGCASTPDAVGPLNCFKQLCPYATGCKFDGATLLCIER